MQAWKILVLSWEINYSWWVRKKETVYTDLLDECFNCLPPFLSCYAFHVISFLQLPFDFGFWFSGRFLTQLQSKTSYYHFLLQIDDILDIQNKRNEIYFLICIGLLNKYMFSMRISPRLCWMDWTDKLKDMVYEKILSAYPMVSTASKTLNVETPELLKCYCNNKYMEYLCSNLVIAATWVMEPCSQVC